MINIFLNIMFEQSLDVFHFFIFIIPGFVTVWAYRFFTDSKSSEIGEFEYFAASCLWGMLLLAIYQLACLAVSRRALVAGLLQNPYSATSVLSLSAMALLGLFLGWCGSIFTRTEGFKAFIRWLKKIDFSKKWPAAE
jgi:hypothetical protein